MTTGAIVTDVPAEEVPTGEEIKPVNPRNAIFNEIAKKSDNERFGEEKPDEDSQAQADTEEELEVTETAQQTEELAKTSVPEKPAEEQMIDIVVDGEKRTVPLSQIVDAGKRTLQKESTADKRLEEATRLREAAEHEAAEQRRINTATEVSDLAKAIQYGTEEEAGAALRRVMELGRQQAQEAIPQADPNAIAAQVMHNMRVNEAMTNSELPPDQGGFADIIADPDLNDLYVRKVLALAATPEGAQKTPWQLCQEVGKSLREKFLKPAEKTGLDEKRERKKNIINLPSASAKVPAKAEEEEETPSQYIERMALERQGAKR